jgi:hypothetical protein
VPRAEALDTAVARAIGVLVGLREPPGLLWLEHMHRRFGVSEFAGSLARFDEWLGSEPQEAPRLRLFRRIADPGSELQFADLDAVSHPSDGIIVSALHCDRLDLSESYADLLGRAVGAGGYYCTHALLAWVWFQEFGGQIPVPAGFETTLFDANAAIANADKGVVTDLKLEAAAFLHLAGQGARVDSAFIDTVLRTQNEDGGWGATRANPDVSDWHGTVLALLLLLLVRRQGGLADRA